MRPDDQKDDAALDLLYLMYGPVLNLIYVPDDAWCHPILLIILSTCLKWDTLLQSQVRVGSGN